MTPEARDIYEEMIAICHKIAASFPPPRFYDACKEDLRLSKSIFAEDLRVLQCRKYVLDNLRDQMGHGVEHAEKVAVEAGALANREGVRFLLKDCARREATVLAQLAGLLHDVRRGEKDHAQASADAAGEVLKDLSLGLEKETYIREAIANHEAFVEPKALDCRMAQIVSDSLYDADKFRWGPDNFTVTLWKMLRFSQAPIGRLVSRFPKGIKGIARIKDTFRTETGKSYGPDFIDRGLQIGEQIYKFLQERFPEINGENTPRDPERGKT